MGCHDAIVRGVVEEKNGVVVKTTGDGIFASLRRA